MNALLKRILFGIRLPQEYITTSAGGISCGLTCFALFDGEKKDVGNGLLFLGYKPFIMALRGSREYIDRVQQTGTIQLVIEETATGKVMAELLLKAEKTVRGSDVDFIILTGISARQRFEPLVQQYLYRLYDRLRKKPPGNADLTGELYNQLKIGYSFPRDIRFVTLGENGRFNLFPIDLQGPISDSCYVLSIRHERLSCKQVEAFRKIAVWSVDASFAKQAYALGKNHSKEPVAASELALAAGKSPHFQLPEPQGVIACDELELVEHIGDYGIHRLLLMKLQQPAAEPGPQRLVHIHRTYAQWHLDKGYPIEMEKR